jgi:hypothetical protein
MSLGCSPPLWAAGEAKLSRRRCEPSLGSKAPQPPERILPSDWAGEARTEESDLVRGDVATKVGKSGMPQTRTMASVKGGHPE